MKLSEILIKLSLDGNAGTSDMEIAGPAKLSDAGRSNISFLANLKYEKELYTTKAGAVLVPLDFSPRKDVSAKLIPCSDPQQAIAAILGIFQGKGRKSGIEEHVHVGKGFKKGGDIYIGAFAYIGDNVSVGDRSEIHPQVFLGDNVQVGKDCILYPGVKVYHDCVIGDNVIIHSGTVIGSDGFGFNPDSEGRHMKVPQIGNVVIGNGVEIGSNCSVDRATMGSTLIEEGVKLDNLIQIGHNVVIGAHTAIAAQTGISGSTKIGHHCIIAGQVGLAGHITIAARTMINAQSGLTKSVKEEGSKLCGSPAIGFIDFYRSAAVHNRLPELEKRVRDIEEILSLLRK